MIKFLDGPAKDQTLMLRRAPIMLRVTRQVIARTFDALDQLTDAPDDGEEIFVYRQESYDGHVHLNCRGKNRSAGGFYPIATYRLLPDQPEDKHVRTNAAWAAWCDANRERLLEGRAAQ